MNTENVIEFERKEYLQLIVVESSLEHYRSTGWQLVETFDENGQQKAVIRKSLNPAK